MRQTHIYSNSFIANSDVCLVNNSAARIELYIACCKFFQAQAHKKTKSHLVTENNVFYCHQIIQIIF